MTFEVITGARLPIKALAVGAPVEEAAKSQLLFSGPAAVAIKGATK